MNEILLVWERRQSGSPVHVLRHMGIGGESGSAAHAICGKVIYGDAMFNDPTLGKGDIDQAMVEGHQELCPECKRIMDEFLQTFAKTE